MRAMARWKSVIIGVQFYPLNRAHQYLRKGGGYANNGNPRQRVGSVDHYKLGENLNEYGGLIWPLQEIQMHTRMISDGEGLVESEVAGRPQLPGSNRLWACTPTVGVRHGSGGALSFGYVDCQAKPPPSSPWSLP